MLRRAAQFAKESPPYVIVAADSLIALLDCYENNRPAFVLMGQVDHEMDDVLGVFTSKEAAVSYANAIFGVRLLWEDGRAPCSHEKYDRVYVVQADVDPEPK